MKFMLMQWLDLIYTKNFSVRKNVANKIATIGGLFARCNRSGLEASNKKQPGASFSCFEKYPQELYRSVCRLANGVLWQMTRVSIYLHVCLRKISCKFLYSKQKAAKRKGRSAVLETALLIMEVFQRDLSVSHVWAREERRQIASYFISQEPASVLQIKAGKLQAANSSSPGLSQINQTSRDC